MPTETHKKALKNGVITQKQYDKLPAKLLDGIIRSKGGPSGKSASKKGKAPKRMDKATKALDVLTPPNKLGQPLYKEGLVKGATAQFQKRYGKAVSVKKPAAFIDMTGGKKRTRKPKKRFAIEG